LRDDESVRPLQVQALDRWSDGSLRWALLDFTADLTEGALRPLSLMVGAGAWATAAPTPAIETRDIKDGVEVDTGAATFRFRQGASFPVPEVVLSNGMSPLETPGSALHITSGGKTERFVVAAVELQVKGPLRAEVHLRAVSATGEAFPLQVVARAECFAGSTALRLSVSIRNVRPATHPGGIWTLGDPGSVFIESATLVVTASHDFDRIQASCEAGDRLEPMGGPLEIYQDSSGGDRWNSRTHINRNGVVPATFRGYRVRSSGTQIGQGLRASPTVLGGAIAVAVPEFWQQCPRALDVRARSIEIGLFPRQSSDVHELQGGEQKTHAIVLSFGPDAVSQAPLAWCHDPLRLYPSPSWCCETGAVAMLLPASADDGRYRSLVEMALDGSRGFIAKREQFDEYGWRHFGDLPGDHESVFQPPDQPFTSHYNNQYDAAAAFAIHFLRSGDVRWWQLMDELVRHVRDIDIYHTDQDKPAYNGGLFWHTQHYTDAGLSTHRTYPRGSGGGGPSAEHNYATGLMLHFFLTGDAASREAAVGLGRWVIDMDDGRRTVFRWLTAEPTGYASATGSVDYHGPGRGPANSILACLVAYRLTADRTFAAKADELIRRCIHPADDIERRNLLDVERRWYYTVFLQALGVYLDEKSDRRELDAMYGYAQASLLHYARWMATHEVPYLTRPEVLEFPNETWPAQDLRKSEVFWWAAGHGSDEERSLFVERARFFFEDATARLQESPRRHFTRPLVLALRNGVHSSWFESALDGRRLWPQGTCTEREAPSPFIPQRTRAIQRGRWMVAATIALALLIGLVAL
jgi:hypothetical protein